MKKIQFERKSGGIEEWDLTGEDSYSLTPGGLEIWSITKGNDNCGTPRMYLRYGVPAVDIAWVEEVIPEDDRGGKY